MHIARISFFYHFLAVRAVLTHRFHIRNSDDLCMIFKNPGITVLKLDSPDFIKTLVKWGEVCYNKNSFPPPYIPPKS